MKTSVSLFIIAITFVFAAAVAANNTTGWTPTGAQIERYPIQKGPLSIGQVAELGLKPVKLGTQWTGFNHYRNLRGGRWVAEVLPPGTIVLEDSASNPIYKSDCGNRLAAFKKCPAATVTPTPGFWDRHPGLKNLLDFLVGLLLGLLGLLALLGLILLASLLGRRIVDELNRPRQLPPPPATTPQPAQPAAPAAQEPARVQPVAAQPAAPQPALVLERHGDGGFTATFR